MNSGLNTKTAFNILAVDGGGARGIYPAQLLAQLEEATGIQARECFDLLAGTSTGSIITSAVATGISMKEVVSLFEEEAPRIFKKRPIPAVILQLLHSKYDRKPLQDVVERYLPDVTLGQVQTPLMIPSADIGTGSVHVFKSGYLRELGESYNRDGRVLLRDAIMASCAAPTFFNPKEVGTYLLADGGIWANNPSILALIEALSKFNKRIEEVRILSIGTGHAATMYGKRRWWGFLTGWKRAKLVSYILALQSQASTNMAGLLLQDQYLRLDPEIEDWQLDDTKHLRNLKALADKDFTYRGRTILRFIGGSRVEKS